MRLELYKRRDEKIWCTITAELSDGQLSITGHDMGPFVEEFIGSDEYKYACSLDRENTRKLFESLGCDDRPDEEKLQVIKETFENNRADSALKKYCDDHGIKTSFWCWP